MWAVITNPGPYKIVLQSVSHFTEKKYYVVMLLIKFIKKLKSSLDESYGEGME